MEQDIKRVTIEWKAGEDPMTEGDITVEDITIGHSTEEQLIEQLRLTWEALKKYGQHTFRCRYRTDPLNPVNSPKCICGFTDVMKLLED